MPQNLELKARISSLTRSGATARNLGARRSGVLEQSDTYFEVPEARLKLREIKGQQSELIYYRRSDRSGARYSDYSVIKVSDSGEMKKLLNRLFRRTVVVKKRRILYLYKNARIHLDTVRGAGTFIEFEVLVTKRRKQARELLEFLKEKFGIKTTMAGSYADMMKSRRRKEDQFSLLF